MKPIRIGRYVMFDATIIVNGVAGTDGGRVDFEWAKEAFITMTISLGSPSWSAVVASALHEVMELAFILRHCHYERSATLRPNDTSRYTLMADHAEFTEICRHAGDMMACLLPDLAKAYNKAKKGAKEK